MLTVALCILPSFSAGVRSVKKPDFNIDPWVIDDETLIARILNKNDKVLAWITDWADISFRTIDNENASELLKKAYAELGAADSLVKLCPSLADRYKTVFGLQTINLDSLVVVKVFEVTLSKKYQELLDVEGNKLQFAITRVVEPDTRVVAICRNAGTWHTVNREVNEAERVVITNEYNDPFALVVTTETMDPSLWDKFIEFWIRALG